MRLLRRIQSLEEHHAGALRRCPLCGGDDAMHPRVVLRRDHRDFDRCPGCGLCIDEDGTVLPTVFTSVRVGVRGF
jgi:hypothetical protein